MTLNDEQLIQTCRRHVDDFVAESQEHLADVEADILAIEAAGDDIDTDLVNKVFRAVHSVKGAAGFLGFSKIGELAHHLESILNLVRGKELRLTSGLTDVVLKAADTLRALINNNAESNQADVSAHVAALQAAVAGGAAETTREEMERTLTVADPQGGEFRVSQHALSSQHRAGHHVYVLAIDLVTDVQSRGQTPLQLIQELTSLGEIVAGEPDWATCGDLHSQAPDRLPFHVLFGTLLETDFVIAAFKLSPAQVHPVDVTALLGSTRVPPAGPAQSPAPAMPAAAAPPVVQPAETASATPPAPEAASRTPRGPVAASVPEASIRVPVAVLDHLMNLAGELVLLRNQLVQAIVNNRTENLHAVGIQLDRITSGLQESIMRTRMQTIATVFGKFPRVVRDLSNQLGKQCDLVMHGQDVELDKSIIEAIGDPLTHLVRNSVDHGIETPAERTVRGKPPVGTITLRAFHQAGKVNIEIVDNGAGIDVSRIRRKAVEQGLVSAERAKEISDREVLRFIFNAGFSTAKVVTDVSGRGVGMDVVRTNVEKLGGTVDIDTEVGVGTTIRVRLPLTLAIIPSLIVRSGTERFALPQVGISELVRIKPADVARRIEHVQNAEVMRLRGSLLPLLRLSTVLNQKSQFLDARIPALRDNQRVRLADRRGSIAAAVPDGAKRCASDRRENTAAGALNIIVLETGHLRYGLVVDALFDSEEIVVKPLGRHVKDSGCLAGATILGDGGVAMILDVAGIASAAELAIPDAKSLDAAEAETGAEHETQSILLFTNHPSEQFAVPMGLITRIERVHLEQVDHVGGQAVLQYRGTSLPLLALEDHIGALPRPEAPKLYVVVFKVSKREVGLIVPRLVDIRQIPRAVDTSTFAEPGVLGSAIVDGKTSRILDVWALTEKAHPEWFADRPEPKGAEGHATAILLAEDSDFFRRQMASFLEGAGYHVVACADGAIAWQTLQDSETAFDLIVTDIEMPNMDGLALTRQIRQDTRFAKLPIIAVTSLAGEADLQRGTQAGVDQYQIKLDRDQLIASITTLLKTRQPARPSTAAHPVAGCKEQI